MYTIESMLNSMPEGQEKQVIVLRLKGYSLLQIGEKINRTKETVRSMQNKAIEKYGEDLEENKYIELFENYIITEEIFQRISDLPKMSYTYLTIITRGSKDRKNIFEIWLKRNKTPAEWMLIRAFFVNKDRNIVSIAKAERDIIFMFILKNLKNKQYPLSRVITGYHRFLVQYNCLEVKPMNEKSFINKLESCPYLLTSKGRAVRYYKITDMDYSKLLNVIVANYPADVELSTLKLYLDNYELMQEYQILDEYELHNLLRKLSEINKYAHYFHNVYFGRMPIIQFGKHTSREKQIMELIESKHLASIPDIAQAYEDKYGIRIESLYASKVFRDCVKDMITTDKD